MKDFILQIIDKNNAFILTFMDKIIAMMNVITTVGRKLTACICATICFTILGMSHMMLLKQPLGWTFWVCFAGVIGFFYGMNILGDHILNGGKGENEGLPTDAKPEDK
jgi:hypothetical protein